MFIVVLICLLLFACYAVLIAYYRRAWKDIPLYSAPASYPRTKITVLVPARNETATIGACLGSLSRQSYPKDLYQVIVIDDHSTDKTWELLGQLGFPGMEFMRLRLADHLPPMDPDLNAYKKFAIDTGIGAATGELIITTDADCRFHPDWLRTIAGFYEDTGAKFIAAPVKIEGDHSFLSLFQTLDFITLQGITGAAVYKRFHSMCNGANLAYERKAFYEVGGFRGIDQIPSGDDLLLMHKIYQRYPGEVFFLKSRQAIVSTQAVTGWKEFFHQRIRWASKADQYDDKRIFWVLLGVYILNLLLIGLLLASFWNYWYGWIFLILLLVKTLIEVPFVRSVAAFFGQQELLVYFPALEPFHILYTVSIGWLGKFGSYRWKDRKINR